MVQPPKIGIDLFWDVLRESQLLTVAAFANAQQHVSSIIEDGQGDAEPIAESLVREKILTPLHCEILLSGHPGPFDFGRYRLIGKTSQHDVWLARDRKTTHPVWLHFFRGASREDLKRWNQIERRAEQASSIRHSNIVQVYETVVTRTHRFIATAVAGGDSLASKMPPKRKLVEAQSLEVIGHVASALTALESQQITHGYLTMDHVFPNVKKGSTKVALPLMHGDTLTPASDVVSLGRMLFRLLTGRDAPESRKIATAGLKKFTDTLRTRNVSAEVGELIFDSIVTHDSMNADDFLQRVHKASTVKSQVPQNRNRCQPRQPFSSVFLPGPSRHPNLMTSCRNSRPRTANLRIANSTRTPPGRGD